MKKVVLAMAIALMAFVTVDAQAQKKSKDAKNAEKAQQELANVALIDRIVPAKNFQFVPFEYIQNTTGTVQINRYEYLKVRPGSLEIYMTNCPPTNTSTYEWISCEKKKDVWVIKMKAVSDQGANLTFDMALNAKTGLGTVKVRSNKSLDPNNPAAPNQITYKGAVREH